MCLFILNFYSLSLTHDSSQAERGLREEEAIEATLAREKIEKDQILLRYVRAVQHGFSFPDLFLYEWHLFYFSLLFDLHRTTGCLAISDHLSGSK